MDESAYTRLVHMFIKLKNCSDGFQDEPLYVNAHHITAVYDHAKVKDGSLTTFVHSSMGTPITWEVEESAKQVMDLIEEAKL